MRKLKLKRLSNFLRVTQLEKQQAGTVFVLLVFLNLKKLDDSILSEGKLIKNQKQHGPPKCFLDTRYLTGHFTYFFHVAHTTAPRTVIAASNLQKRTLGILPAPWSIPASVSGHLTLQAKTLSSQLGVLWESVPRTLTSGSLGHTGFSLLLHHILRITESGKGVSFFPPLFHTFFSGSSKT